MTDSPRSGNSRKKHAAPPAPPIPDADMGRDMPEVRSQTVDSQGKPLLSDLYKTALDVVRQEFSDPAFDPHGLVSKVSRSRASLYRTFALNGQTVAGMIWSVRLDCAWRMLTSGGQSDMLLADVALRCGFADQSTFSRMFKRRYGISPREARALSA